jgi:alpha-beta hydrolase superfamily lysophospholipase
MAAMRHHKLSFTVALTCISRVLILRDRVLGWVGPGSQDTPGLSAARLKISSGANLLDAVFVQPTASPARAAMLLCHGIGETVQHWFPVQRLLAANGVASLVFDYSGYGRSTGRPSSAQFDLDALSAFQTLRRHAHPLPTSILGFSLGSGPAVAIVNAAAPDYLVLCGAFTSFRDALHAIGLPARLSPLVPPLWSAQQSLRDCRVPVLVVHGQNDRLFPVQMARDLASCCPGPVELLIVSNLAHNQLFRKPDLSFWGPIIARLYGES